MSFLTRLASQVVSLDDFKLYDFISFSLFFVFLPFDISFPLFQCQPSVLQSWPSHKIQAISPGLRGPVPSDV
jgi:hypothetical protein